MNFSAPHLLINSASCSIPVIWFWTSWRMLWGSTGEGEAGRDLQGVVDLEFSLMLMEGLEEGAPPSEGFGWRNSISECPKGADHHHLDVAVVFFLFFSFSLTFFFCLLDFNFLLDLQRLEKVEEGVTSFP